MWEISKPLNTRQTSVSSLLRRPGNRSGRHIIGAQPGRSGFSSIELVNRNRITLQQTQISETKLMSFLLFQKILQSLNEKSGLRCLKHTIFNTHFESLLFQLMGCGQEIGSERMLEWWEQKHTHKCSIINTTVVSRVPHTATYANRQKTCNSSIILKSSLLQTHTTKPNRKTLQTQPEKHQVAQVTTTNDVSRRTQKWLDCNHLQPALKAGY